MNDTIREPVRRLRQRRLATTWLCGTSTVIAAVLGLGLAFGSLDWLVHVDDAGTRALCLLAVLSAGSFAAWRYLVSPLRSPVGDVELATDIESALPSRCRGLASGVAFAEGGMDPAVGSTVLQRMAIDRVAARIRRIDTRRLVSMRETWLASSAAIAVCLLTVLTFAVARADASLALRRLVSPFDAPEWPRRTDLRWLDADLQPLALEPGETLRVARGRSLELFVENAIGALPDDVTLRRRLDEKTVPATPLRTLERPGHDGTRRTVARVLVDVDAPVVELRVAGGDHDDMPFLRIEAVEPPNLEELQVTLTPPAYSGQPVSELPRGVGHVSGLVGTIVEVRARSTKPLDEAVLRIGQETEHAVIVADDGRDLAVTFAIERPGVQSYWLRMTDRSGYEAGGEVRYELRGIADAAPSVTIEEPETNLNVTPTARVPFRVSAKDDLGLTRLDLVADLSTDSGAGTESRTIPLGSWIEPTLSARLEHSWDLASLKLQPGARIVVHAEAADGFGPPEPNVAHSTPRTITIVGPRRKADELAARESALHDDLDDLVQRQRRARDRIGELRVQLETDGRLADGDRDLLNTVESDQRRIEDGLVGETGSVLSEVRRLRDEMRDNDVDDPKSRERIAGLIDTLVPLGESVLPGIASDLVTIRKDIDSARNGRPSAATRDGLNDVAGAQDEVLSALEAQLDALARSRNRRELEGDLGDLASTQREIRDRTAALLGRDDRGTGRESRADRERIAERQRSQADAVERLREKLDQAATRIASSDPDEADRLRDAAREVGERATASAMREAAAELQRGNPGRSLDVQERVLSDLAEAAATLANRTESDTEALVERLRDAEETLELLEKRQRDLFDANDDATTEDELQKLSKRQDDIRDELAREARRARRLGARRASDSARRAVRGLDDVQRLLKDSRTRDLAEDREREVLDDLEQSRRELADSRREAEERLARELLETAADRLRSMAERQRAIVEELRTLEPALRERTTPSRSQSRAVIALRDAERVLAGETGSLGESMAAAEVFVLVLEATREHMEAVAERLARRVVDETTVDRAQRAHARLADLLKVVDEKRNDAGATGGGPGNEPESEGNPGPRVDVVALLAQVRLVRTLQQDLLERTTTLDTQRDAGTITVEAAETERAEIADRQDELADIFAELVRKLSPPRDETENEEN